MLQPQEKTVTRSKKATRPSPWMAGINIDEFDSIPKAVKYAGGSYWICNYHHATGDSENITSEIIDKAHAIGIKVIAWTLDSKSDMKKLIKTGVDGITTNRPDLLLSVLKRYLTKS